MSIHTFPRLHFPSQKTNQALVAAGKSLLNNKIMSGVIIDLHSGCIAANVRVDSLKVAR